MVEIVLNSAQGIYKIKAEGVISGAILITIDDFMKDYEHPDTNKSLLFANYLKVLITKIERAGVLNSLDISENTNQIIFQNFICHVERDLFKTRNVSYYCKCLGVSPRKLALVCNEFRNKSAKNILDERLVSETKFLLVRTAHSIKYISSLTGFSDQYQFSKYFKKHAHISPSRYREVYTKRLPNKKNSGLK